MTMNVQWKVLAAVAVAAIVAVLYAQPTLSQVTQTQPTGTSALDRPVMRTLLHVFNRASQDPGPFKSIGYMTFIAGLSGDELFAVSPADPTAAVNEANARFSVVENGTTVRVVPNTFFPVRPGENNTQTTAYSQSIFSVYYDSAPSRDWTRPETFETGQLVVQYNFGVILSYVDFTAGVGTSSSDVTLVSATPFTLSSGRNFTFSQFGEEMVVDSQIQSNSGLTSPDPELPVVVGEADVWKAILN